jgi:hypothetical protein
VTARRPRSTPKPKVMNKAIDKSVPGLPDPRGLPDRDHVKYVAGQSYPSCGRRPSDAHRLRFAQSRALGRKVSDEFTVPHCREHNGELHRGGDEGPWWCTKPTHQRASSRRAKNEERKPTPAKMPRTNYPDRVGAL